MTDDRTPDELLAEAQRLAELAQERSEQISRADLARMTPQAINEARRQGRLDNILQGE